MKPYYEDDLVTLYHGDCRDVLEDESFDIDLLLTDPPYGMNWSAQSATAQGAVAGDGARQGVRLLRQTMQAANRHLADDVHVLVFCHWESWPDFYDAIRGAPS